MALKDIAKEIVYRSARMLPNSGAVILMYHSIGDEAEFFSVSANEFEKQLRYLVQHDYHVIPLDALVKIMREGKTIPANTVVITIDDGYQNNYTHAFPLLQKYKIPASIFVVTGKVGDKTTARKGSVIPMLTWEQIDEMHTSGLIGIYPHTQTHPKLPTLGEFVIKEEIKKSMDSLQAHTISPVLFAYPYGLYNEKVIAITKELGVQAAVSVVPGRVQLGDDLYTLKRNSVDSKVSFNMFKGIVHFGRIALGI